MKLRAICYIDVQFVFHIVSTGYFQVEGGGVHGDHGDHDDRGGGHEGCD